MSSNKSLISCGEIFGVSVCLCLVSFKLKSGTGVLEIVAVERNDKDEDDEDDDEDDVGERGEEEEEEDAEVEEAMCLVKGSLNACTK